MNAYLEKSDAKFFYFVSREALNPEAKLQARMIFYNGEDPATGSPLVPVPRGRCNTELCHRSSRYSWNREWR